MRNKEQLYDCSTHLSSLVTFSNIVRFEFWLWTLGLLPVADGRGRAVVLTLALGVVTDRDVSENNGIDLKSFI